MYCADTFFSSFACFHSLSFYKYAQQERVYIWIWLTLVFWWFSVLETHFLFKYKENIKPDFLFTLSLSRFVSVPVFLSSFIVAIARWCTQQSHYQQWTIENKFTLTRKPIGIRTGEQIEWNMKISELDAISLDYVFDFTISVWIR